ncbi:MAG: acyl-CoA thioesterase [Azonexus sp.]|jgi:acyl-CoA thioester hydrolase|nr:acyl-CoA thioesterase [Betaproteobacteria bacterium]MBK8918027.1 acyl-CoA thioesterase [Betaproteobacteria bacterium]MBP6036772.1 acyl-CoA thioesterase [Azonexus sp.]MBP6907331.1 acyl-CoA thioesterase [Azonexus sp.]
MHSARKLIHRSTIPIRWGDMDAYGHVNNTVYFRYMEIARIEWLEAMGYGLDPAGEGPVIINASCTFLIPLTYPGSVEVLTYTAPPGRSSVQTRVEMRPSGSSALFAEGAAKVVWMDHRTGRSAPLPVPLRAALEAE